MRYQKGFVIVFKGGTSFTDFNIQILAVTFIPTFTTNAKTRIAYSQFSLVEFGCSLTPIGIYISLLVRFARCCTSVLSSLSKNLQITSKLLTEGYKYHNLKQTKIFEKFFRPYSWAFVQICWNIVSRLCFRRFLSSGLLLWSRLQTNEGQRLSEFRHVGLEICLMPST